MQEQPAPLLASEGAMQLLQVLRDGKPRSRARLADHCGIARSTAGLRVDELIEVGLVEEGEASYTGGRPSTKVQLVPRARLVLAVDIGATHARIALVDLVGVIIGQRSRQLNLDAEPSAILDWMLSECGSLCEELDLSPQLISAAGIGLAAPIERGTGRPVDPPIMPKWRDFDVRDWLSGLVSYPVLVEKDVNIMALGEFVVDPLKRGNMIFAKIATGIGVGIISGGRLQRGAQGLAGDVGHVRVDSSRGTPCRCGNVGCLEAVASGPSLARALTSAGTPAATSQDVVDLVWEGSLEATQLVRQAGRDLGEVLATCVSLLNPSTVILGGKLAEAGEHLLAGVREAVYARSMPLATKSLTIAHTTSGPAAALRGAAALAIDHIMVVGRHD